MNSSNSYNLEANSNPFELIASDIKLIVMDIDGVLTDGGIIINESGEQARIFNTKDGMAIRLLQLCKCSIALVSGGNKNIANKRAESLDIKYVFTGISNKLNSISTLQKELRVTPEQTLFLGDDVNDLIALPVVRMFLVPSDAHKSCIASAHWVGERSGGHGFVREFADLFLQARGLNPFQPMATSN